MQTSLFSNNIRVRHVSDGTTDTFSCTIELIDESYLQVYFGETLQPDGWTYDESFQQVVFDEIPAEGTIITFLRYFPTIYTKSITEKGIINPEVLDNQMVEMVARIQTVEEKLSRTPIYPIDTEKSSEEVYDDFKRIESVATSAATKVLDTLEEIEDVRNEAVLGMGAAADAAKLNVSKYTSQMIDVIKDEGQESIDIARTWATGEQAEVEAIEAGQLSSRGFADLSLAFANAPEDVPVDESGMIAMEVFRGPKGDKGEDGKDGVDGKDGADGKDGRDGSGIEIGDIGFAPLGIDETKNLRRYLNGQVISQTQFETFTDIIKERAKLYPNIIATEENWQAEVTNSKLGQCGKFVIDDEAGTIRLPKVVNIKGLQDLSLLGSIKEESLPNITGAISCGVVSNSYEEGALYKDAQKTGYDGAYAGSTSNMERLALDASRSSSTYQDNAPVQQEAIQYPYFIQVASGTEESVDVTREIELNNPFFLGMSQYFESEPNNASWLKADGSFHSGATYVSFYEWLLKIYNGTEIVEGVSVKASTDTYDDYDYVINITDTTFRLPIKTTEDFVVENYQNGTSWYRVYKSGWLEQGGQSTINATVTYIKRFSNTNYSIMVSSDSAYYENVYVRNKTVSSFYSGATAYDGSYNDVFWIAKGQGAEIPASKMYYYVGETIQDANVIAASQVLTDVANLKGYTAGIPDYTAGVTFNSGDTVPAKGIISGTEDYNAGVWKVYVNGYQIAAGNAVSGSQSTWCIIVGKGDIVTYNGANTVQFFPFRGVN